jgi:4-diphosphocytidyl-2-C-methyl-D-erythritol kinase
MKYIEIKAPAKINIGLDIIAKRSDGFHDIHTLFYPIMDLFDILKIERSTKFSFICNEPSIPIDELNLVVKAKILLEKNTGKIINANIMLDKLIPTQAGLGGGSSDAAATLISLNEMFNLALKFDQILDIALELGSDVPFFIKAKPAIGTSRGEVLTNIDVEISEPILIVNPRINIPTKQAFSMIIPKNSVTNYSEFVSNGKFNFNKAKRIVKNDFEDYVFREYPEIAEIKKLMYDCGAILSLMSGSGSSVFGIFNEIDDIKKIEDRLPKTYFRFRSTQLE